MPEVQRHEVTLKAGDVSLEGMLSVPENATGIVLFAHGSGSGRHSPRNRFVAESLDGAGISTLLFDLLTADEEEVDRHMLKLRFDIPLLSERLVAAIDWVERRPDVGRLPVGLFGASTGAAAALIAAVRRPDRVAAVVSRGGRPDLAGGMLSKVEAPTLLIVGGEDAAVLQLNRAARARLQAKSRLDVVPGAGHLFEEPGKLERVTEVAREWFQRHLKGVPVEPGTLSVQEQP